MNRFSGMLQAFIGMLVLLALDQFSKIWVRETIPLYEMTPHWELVGDTRIELVTYGL